MKRIILFQLMIAFSFFSISAKSWKIVGDLLEADTTMLVQDAVNLSQYKYIGKITNKSFRVFDGVDYYIPICGMNDPFGQQVDMAKQVEDSEQGFRVSYVNPNNLYRITVTDGTLKQIIIETVIPYDNIYLVGGPINTHNPNWMLSDAQELEKDSLDPFVFYYRGFLKYNTFGDEPGSIKFLTSNLAWEPAFHPIGNSNVALERASKIRIGGADTKWEIPADGTRNGYYVIKLNTLDETISIEQFEYADVNYPTNVFIAGDAMPCGWNNSTPEIMTPTDIFKGTYSWTGNVFPGQFKFLKNKGSWGSCYVSTIKDQAVEYDKIYPIVYEFEYFNNGGNDFKFMISESDRCIINVDLSKMQLSVKKEVQNSTEGLKDIDDILITTTSGNIVVKSSSSSKKMITVFSIDGTVVFTNSFIYNSEIALSKGYYIVRVIDSLGKEKIKKIIV